MPDHFWQGEWPNYASISVALPLGLLMGVTPATTGILLRLVAHLAREGVHGFFSSAKLDPSLPISPKELRAIAHCKPRELKEAQKWFEVLFEERDGRLRLIDETVVRYTRPLSRQAIATDARAAVAARDGMRCVYCGSIQGPFHHDHIFPVARGGRNDPNNLVVACATCNLSKKDMTLLEWVSAMRAQQ